MFIPLPPRNFFLRSTGTGEISTEFLLRSIKAIFLLRTICGIITDSIQKGPLSCTLPYGGKGLCRRTSASRSTWKLLTGSVRPPSRTFKVTKDFLDKRLEP